MNTHCYFQFRGHEGTSEHFHYHQVLHFQTKIDFGSMRMKTQKEKDELKTRMLAYPNKNHYPIN